MKYKIEHKDPMQVMGIALRTTNENWQVAKEIGPFWGRFYKENIHAKIPHKKTGEVLGLYCDYEKDHTKPYTIIAGCEVTLVGDVPEGLVVKKIPASTYAVFEVKGAFPEALMNAWQWVWDSSLKRTYKGDFELYPHGFDPETKPNLFLYVGIKE